MVVRHFNEELSASFPAREAEQMMEILLEDLFGIDRKARLMQPDMRIDEWQHHQLEEAVKALLQGEPIQYVTGKAVFCDLCFKVDSSVLIPRPETEEMVRMIIAEGGDPRRIWDIGTGSGCIAISLAKAFGDAEVMACDVSLEALETARENALMNDTTVTFVEGDVLALDPDVFEGMVDLLVSNPPYVMDKEREAMQTQVLDYEPHEALFVPDNDPLLYYRALLQLANDHLASQGVAWFEINEAMGDSMLNLCHEMGFLNARIIDDYAGKPRFCRIVMR